MSKLAFAKSVILAKPIDLSKGFSDFFSSIDVTGSGLVRLAVPAVLVVVAGRMALQCLGENPKTAMRKGAVAVGTLMVAVLLAVFGGDIFGTLPTGGTQ
ncbi:hypothetical protein [Streptomyces sp. NPDC088785]|uniref:hypothetical protein n=1 Tax=Streptomyces sp. NPDC088785 TaxID=3365897 RepID=UPI0037F39D71